MAAFTIDNQWVLDQEQKIQALSAARDARVNGESCGKSGKQTEDLAGIMLLDFEIEYEVNLLVSYLEGPTLV